MTFALVLEREDPTIGAWVPALPGCFAVGTTEADVLARIRGAIELHLGELRAAGEPVPGGK